MKVVVAGVVLAAVVVGARFGLFAKVSPTVLDWLGRTQSLTKLVSFKRESPANSSPAPEIAPDQKDSNGEIAGLSTSTESIGQGLLETGTQISKTVSKIFTTNPDNSTQKIEVAKVVQEVSNRIESIPSTLLNQAKVEYCKQVIAEASRSATSHFP